MKKHLTLLSVFVFLAATAGCSSAPKPGAAPAAASAPSASPTPLPAASAPKSTPGTTSAGEMQCAHGSDERILTLIGKSGGCELSYQKFGNTEVIATAVAGTSYCESVRDKVKNNLETAGFTCK